MCEQESESNKTRSMAPKRLTGALGKGKRQNHPAPRRRGGNVATNNTPNVIDEEVEEPQAARRGEVLQPTPGITEIVGEPRSGRRARIGEAREIADEMVGGSRTVRRSQVGEPRARSSESGELPRSELREEVGEPRTRTRESDDVTTPAARTRIFANQHELIENARGLRISAHGDSVASVSGIRNARTTSDNVKESNSMNEVESVTSATGDRNTDIEGRSLSTSEALKLIPEHDGANMSIDDYSYDCKIIYDMSKASDKKIILRLMLSKIKGSAKEIVKRKEYATLEELINDLSKVFGTDDDYTKISNELGKLSQTEGESVIEWGVKVKRYVDDMIALSKKECGNNIDVIRMVTQQGITIYVRGIKPTINQHLVGMKFGTLDEVISRARRIESEINANKDVYKSKESIPTLREVYKIESSPNEENPRSKIICHRCKKPGHIARNCFLNKNQDQQNAAGTSNNGRADNMVKQEGPRPNAQGYNNFGQPQQNNPGPSYATNPNYYNPNFNYTQPANNNNGYPQPAGNNANYSQAQNTNGTRYGNPNFIYPQSTGNNANYNQNAGNNPPVNPTPPQNNGNQQQTARQEPRSEQLTKGQGDNRSNNNAGSTVVCYNCRQEGHIKRNCTNRAACDFCERTGHEIKECRIFKLKCRKCKIRGHVERYCTQDQRRQDYLNSREPPKNE